jgi:hypothetical protein
MDNDELFVGTCHPKPSQFLSRRSSGRRAARSKGSGFPVQRKTLEPLVTAKFTFAVYGRIF